MTAQARALILVTRPEPGASRFAAALRARFGAAAPVIVAPLMEPAYADAPLPPALAEGRAGGLVFTSAAGVEGLARRCPGLALPAFCVGARTAAAARAAGHAAEALGGDADALVAALVARGAAGGVPLPLVHARGADSRGQVADRLTAAGLPTEEAVVYAQTVRTLAPEAAAALAGRVPVVVPVFSPRSARILAAAAQRADAPLLLAAISPAALAAWDGRPVVRTAIAPAPDEAGMLAAVASLVDAAASA
jgi:uroporphyrinogen-III synthase